MLSTLSRFRVQLLHILICWEYDRCSSNIGSPDDLDIQQEPKASAHCFPHYPLDSLDLEELGRNTARCVSSLKYLCLHAGPRLEIWGLRDDVQEGDSPRRLIKLSQQEGYRIIYNSVFHQTY